MATILAYARQRPGTEHVVGTTSVLPLLEAQGERRHTMTTPELLSLMRLLSAMESAMLASKIVFPDYLSDEVTRHTEILEREILARSNP